MGVTIKDVAREAGVSISTVSKALNNCYSISGETTTHVKEVAKRLSYTPNARAQTLARQLNKEVTLLTDLHRDIAFSNPHLFEIMAGAEEALSMKGYSLTVKNCNPDTICTYVSDLFDCKGSDGILLHVSVVTRELATLLANRKIPHITIGKPEFSNSLCWIDNNNQFSGEIAAGYLLDMGLRDIAFIGGTDEDKISHDRMLGANARLRGEKLQLTSVRKGDSTVQEGMRMCYELLSQGEIPEAIICANNLLAFGCLSALQNRGIKVPDEVSLITFDDYPLAQYTSPTLSNVSIDLYDMGIEAAKILLRKIKNHQMQVQTYATIPQLVVRESTKNE